MTIYAILIEVNNEQATLLRKIRNKLEANMRSEIAYGLGGTPAYFNPEVRIIQRAYQPADGKMKIKIVTDENTLPNYEEVKTRITNLWVSMILTENDFRGTITEVPQVFLTHGDGHWEDLYEMTPRIPSG